MISERLLRIGVMSSNDYLLPLLHEAEQVSDIYHRIYSSLSQQLHVQLHSEFE